MMTLNQGVELAILAALLAEAPRLVAKAKPNKAGEEEQLSLNQLRAETGFWQLHYAVQPKGISPEAMSAWPFNRHEVAVTLHVNPEDSEQLQLEMRISCVNNQPVNDQFRFTMSKEAFAAETAARELTDIMLSLFNKKKFGVNISKSAVFVEMLARTRQLSYGRSEPKAKAE